MNNPLTSGVGTTATGAQSLVTNTAIANFQYSQNLRTGTNYAISYANTRTSTTSPAVLFNPALQSVGTLSFSQPLLNGFGRFVNNRYYEVALITKKAVDFAFRQSLITEISNVENDYWELVYARGEVDVQQRASTWHNAFTKIIRDKFRLAHLRQSRLFAPKHNSQPHSRTSSRRKHTNSNGKVC